MEPYNDIAATIYKLKSNNDWLRQRQGLALPALPPTTPEAHRYFFSNIQKFSTLAANSGKGRIDYESFAKEWNRSADGKTRFYITTEVLATYGRTWEKTNNTRASKELISEQLEHIHQSQKIFAAPQASFPTFLTGSSTAVHPQQGVIDLDQVQRIPTSLSVELSISRPSVSSSNIMANATCTSVAGNTRDSPEAAIPGSDQDAIDKPLM